jgi:hypothetical protein
MLTLWTDPVYFLVLRLVISEWTSCRPTIHGGPLDKRVVPIPILPEVFVSDFLCAPELSDL